MGYAQHIGRVGALAVALGVGAAVATGYGVPLAHADETNETAAEHDVEQPGEQGGNDGNETPGGGEVQTPTVSINGNPVSGTDNPAGGTGSGDTTVPEMDFNAQGVDHNEDGNGNGAGNGTIQGSIGQAPPAADPPVVLEPPVNPAPADPAPPTNPEPPTSPSPPAGNDTNQPAAPNNPQPGNGPPNQPANKDNTDNGGALESGVNGLSVIDNNADDNSGGGANSRIATFNTFYADDNEGAQTFSTSLIAPQPNIIEPEQPDLWAGIATIPGIALRLAATVGAAFLAPFAIGGPTGPAQPPVIWAVLAWVRREFQRTLFNQTPNAVDDTTVATNEDHTVTIDVLANDTDTDEDPITVTDYTQPEHGHVDYDPVTKKFTYTPELNWHGTDTFRYAIDDNDGAPRWHGILNGLSNIGHQDTATVTVTVTPVDDAPTANPDTYTTAEDTAVLVNALRNDSDPDGDTLDRNLVTPPRFGTLAEINDGPNAGAWTYTPNADFNGVDTFTYRTYDGANLSDAVTVTITVTPVNDAPTAVYDNYGATEDTTLTVGGNGVLGNDTDVDREALTAHLVTGPATGTLDLHTDGSFTYAPATDTNGTVTFTYRTYDGTTFGNSATVTITVTAVADPPVAADDTVRTAEDTALSGDVLANDGDVDTTALTASLAGGAAHGTAVVNTDGSFTYTPAANYHGPDSFTYTVSDGTFTDTATVNITVTAVNDEPAAVGDAYTMYANGVLTVPAVTGVLANDADPDAGDTLTVAVLQAPAHGSVILNADGSFTYTPNGNFTGADTFTYTATDTKSGTDTATVTVTVIASPVVARDDAYTMFVDDRLEFRPALTANDTNGTGNPLGAVNIVAPPTHGILFESGGVVTYRPFDGYVGTDTFTYTVADSSNPDVVSNIATVTITVNRLITANDDTYTVFAEDRLEFTPALTANDTTAIYSPLGAVTIVDRPTHGSLFESGGVLTYRPGNGYVGTDTFTYTVADSRNPAIVSNIATVTINVIPYNPLTANDDNYRVLADTSTDLTPAVTANDTTDLYRDLGAVNIVSGPAHGSITQTNGRLTYTPTTGYVGSDTFTYTVADSLDPTIVSVPGTVTLTVVAVTANDDAYSVPAETTIVITPTANDAAATGNPLSAISVVTGPTYGTLDTTNGVLTYTPRTRYVGTDTFTYTVADSANPGTPSNLATVTLTVLPYTPVDANDDAYTVRTGETTVLTPVVTANDSTTWSPSLGAVTIVTGPAHGMATVRDGVLTYRSYNDFTGTDTFTYTVADGADPAIVSNPATVTLTVVADRAMTARDDTVTVFTDEPIELIPLINRNDFSETGNAFGAITVLIGPTNGTLTQANGTLTYIPDTGFKGVDSLVYTVADSVDPALVSNAATVTLTVRDPITANYDYYATSAGVAIVLDDPTANDVTYTGNPLAKPTIFTQPLNGNVTSNLGVFVYTPNAGFTGLDTFYYTVTDSVNTTYTATGLVFVTVATAG